MNQEIEESEIVTTIIRRIKFDFKDDISIFACYGSASRDSEYTLSDLGFYIVPKTKRGFTLTRSFLLSSLGCDLWPMSWEQVDEISKCKTNSTSILADSTVLFYSRQEDLDRFRKSRENIQKTLNNRVKNRSLCNKRIVDLKEDFFHILRFKEGFSWDIKIISFLENYLIVLATLNKTYIHRGIQDFRHEIEQYLFTPLDLERRLLCVLNGVDKDRIKDQLKSLFFDLIDLVPGSIESFTNFKAVEIKKIFNRVRFNYKRILKSIEDNDLIKVKELADKVDEKTDKLLKDRRLYLNYPKFKGAEELDDISQICANHERVLNREYEMFFRSIKDYESLKDINSPFL